MPTPRGRHFFMRRVSSNTPQLKEYNRKSRNQLASVERLETMTMALSQNDGWVSFGQWAGRKVTRAAPAGGRTYWL
ncbi:MAG: hypothetical protein VYC71_02825 [Planctomycetota bacterium]|nr:hypothetical protein [Planctomycetota bacterium]